MIDEPKKDTKFLVRMEQELLDVFRKESRRTKQPVSKMIRILMKKEAHRIEQKRYWKRELRKK